MAHLQLQLNVSVMFQLQPFRGSYPQVPIHYVDSREDENDITYIPTSIQTDRLECLVSRNAQEDVRLLLSHYCAFEEIRDGNTVQDFVK